MTFSVLLVACGAIVGWQARKYRELPQHILAKLFFWRRGK